MFRGCRLVEKEGAEEGVGTEPVWFGDAEMSGVRRGLRYDKLAGFEEWNGCFEQSAPISDRYEAEVETGGGAERYYEQIVQAVCFAFLINCGGCGSGQIFRDIRRMVASHAPAVEAMCGRAEAEIRCEVPVR